MSRGINSEVVVMQTRTDDEIGADVGEAERGLVIERRFTTAGSDPFDAFEWIEKDIGIEFGEWDMPIVDKVTYQSTNPKIFFGGDAAWGPENIIWAAAHGHQAAISIHKFCAGEDLFDRPKPGTNLVTQKMGIHEWSYDNDISQAKRNLVPHADQAISLKNLKVEVELGFDEQMALEEAQR